MLYSHVFSVFLVHSVFLVLYVFSVFLVLYVFSVFIVSDSEIDAQLESFPVQSIFEYQSKNIVSI